MGTEDRVTSVFECVEVSWGHFWPLGVSFRLMSGFWEKVLFS